MTSRSVPSSGEFVYLKPNHHESASVLRKMYETSSLSDVTLFGEPPAGSASESLPPIRAYKVVLALTSPYFFDLFTVDGHIDSTISEQNIENVGHVTLSRIVEYIHADNLLLNSENATDVVLEMLVGAIQVKAEELRAACESFLVDQQVKSGNCISLWCSACKYGCSQLKHATSSYIAKRYLDSLPKDVNFLRMPFADCAKLLTSEPFAAANGGDCRYRAAVAWLNYDPESRGAAHAFDILSTVPLGSAFLRLSTILEPNNNDMLREYVPEMLRQAVSYTLKTQAILTCTSASVRKADNKNNYNFLVFIETLCGSYPCVVKCMSFTTVEEVKQCIRDSIGVPLDHMRLIFAGRQLEDEMTMSDCGIDRDCVVLFVLRTRGCVCDCMAHKAEEMWAKSDKDDEE